jgi:hypothetical protein
MDLSVRTRRGKEVRCAGIGRTRPFRRSTAPGPSHNFRVLWFLIDVHFAISKAKVVIGFPRPDQLACDRDLYAALHFGVFEGIVLPDVRLDIRGYSRISERDLPMKLLPIIAVAARKTEIRRMSNLIKSA